MSNKYIKFHGIKLADNSVIESLRIEQVAADPTPAAAGRLWYNTTEKVFKFSSLDGSDQVVVRQAVSLQEMTSAIAVETAARVADVNAEETARQNADAALQSELDATQTGAGLAADGSLTQHSGTNYIDSATTLKGTDALLDAAIKAVSDEINTSQSGTGLNTDGSYTADGSSNFITTATSLKNADSLLDAQIKVNADAITAEATSRASADSANATSIGNVQSELDATQSGAGLGADGAYSANGSATYISGASSLSNADDLLDSAVAAVQSEVDATQTGAGLNTDGSYTANGSTNYLASATSLKSADEALDAQIKSVADSVSGSITTGISGLQAEVDAVENAVGLAADGTFVSYSGTNYLDSTTSMKTADEALDSAIKSVSDVADAAVEKAGDTMAGTLNMSSNRITNLPSPSDDADAATKGYVDATASGLDVKASVRATTTANVNLSSALANGSVVDGVTLSSGDRVLVKDQTDASENGIYVVQASGAAVRATDFDSNSEVTSGAFTFVEEGTVNANNGFVLVTDGAVNVGSTNMAFEQFSGAGQIEAGAGIKKNGNELFLSFGAGVVELPSDEIGLDLASDSGMMLSVDGSTASTDTAATLQLKLDGNTLTKNSNGVRVATSVITDILNLQSDATSLQSELDDTQAAAGLNTDGTFAAHSGSNYIDSATTMKEVDAALDAQIKTVADSVAGSVTSGITGLQTEVDAIETAAGLNADGTFSAHSGTNYLDSATTMKEVDAALDSQLESKTSELDSLISDVEGDLATETAARISGDSAIRSAVNSTKFTFQSTSTATTHTISHNLNSNFLVVQVMVLGDDGLYANDLVPVEETDANTLTCYLTESRHVRVSVMSMSDI